MWSSVLPYLQELDIIIGVTIMFIQTRLKEGGHYEIRYQN